jgi:DNA (cytosine-5)-methyltransferase 1
MFRIIGELQPQYVFAENVDEGAIIAAQSDLADIGYKTIRGMVAAGDVGADHPRKRWWLAADSDNESKLGSRINAKMAFEQARNQSLWEAGPGKSRMDDGFPHRVDRLRCIGNGQVPSVAALAWDTLREEV